MDDKDRILEHRVLRHLVDALPDAIMTTTPEGVIIEANPASHKLFHRDASRLHGTSVFSYLVDEYGAPLESVIGRIINSFQDVRSRHVFVKWGAGEDEQTSCCLTAYPLIVEENGVKRIDRVVGIFRDQTELEKLVTTDKLTGLLNENGLAARLTEHVLLARRKKFQLAIAYMDLSKFKPVNDTFGHDEGDRALMKFGARLKAGIFDTDIGARKHGDEFVALLIRPEFASLGKIANKLVQATRFPIDLRHKDDRLETLNISASIGICWREGAGIPEDPKYFLALADKAMYKCKHSPTPVDYVIDANGTHGP